VGRVALVLEWSRGDSERNMIAYLTHEDRGEWTPPEQHRADRSG
jgi:hypothetical protein